MYYYAKWRDEDIFALLNIHLTGLARVKEGRAPEPTAAIVDTQSAKTSTNLPLETRGTDAAKRIIGRKRSIAIILSLLILRSVDLGGCVEDIVLDTSVTVV